MTDATATSPWRHLPNALTVLRMTLVVPLAWMIRESRYDEAVVVAAHLAQDVHGQIAHRGVVGAQKRLDRGHHVLAADAPQRPVGRFLHAEVMRAQQMGQKRDGRKAPVLAGIIGGVPKHVGIVAAKPLAKLVAVHHAGSLPVPRRDGHL